MSRTLRSCGRLALAAALGCLAPPIVAQSSYNPNRAPLGYVPSVPPEPNPVRKRAVANPSLSPPGAKVSDRVPATRPQPQRAGAAAVDLQAVPNVPPTWEKPSANPGKSSAAVQSYLPAKPDRVPPPKNSVQQAAVREIVPARLAPPTSAGGAPRSETSPIPSLHRSGSLPYAEPTWNKISPAPDWNNITPVADSTRIVPVADTNRNAPAPDWNKITPVTNTTRIVPLADSTRIAPLADSTKIAPLADSTRIVPLADSTRIAPVPATIATVAARPRITQGTVIFEDAAALSSPSSLNPVVLEKRLRAACGRHAREVQVLRQGDGTIRVRVTATTATAGQALVHKLCQIEELAAPGVRLEFSIAP